MARILVAAMPFAGHVGVMAAVAAELAGRGHDIVAYTGAKYGKRFTDVGAQWLPWERATDYDDADLAATFPAVGDGKSLRGGLANVQHVLLGTGAGQAADLLAEAARVPVDLLVSDHLAFGTGLAAEKLGRPWASVMVTPLQLSSRDLPPPGFPALPARGALGRRRDKVLRAVVRTTEKHIVDPMVNRMRADADLGPVAGGLERLLSPHLIVAQGSEGFEYPRTDLPERVRFVGRLALPSPEAELPTWWPDIAAAREAGIPVVHVTQGTLDVDPRDLLRPAMAGLAGERMLVVCSTDAGDNPANVRTAPFLPHDKLLPLVDAMVTNGGWNGVLAALDAGVPLVVAGRSLDKPEVARRVAWSGSGLNLRTGKPSPARIRDAVRRVLAEPRTRRRAAEIGAQLAAGGGAAAAADLVERLDSNR